MADMTACDMFDLSFCEILYPVNWDPFGKDIILEKFAVRYDMMDCADASLNCENEQQLGINQSVEFTLSHPVISFVISNIQQGTKLIQYDNIAAQSSTVQKLVDSPERRATEPEPGKWQHMWYWADVMISLQYPSATWHHFL